MASPVERDVHLPADGGDVSLTRASLVSVEMQRIGSDISASSAAAERSFHVSEKLTDLAEKRMESAVKALGAKKRWAMMQKLADSERFHTTAAYPLRYLWHRPRLRQDLEHKEDGEMHEVHEHWIELFNDLIMVAMLSNLSHMFEVGGQRVANFGLSIILWCLAMQSIHFVSYVVNVWQVDDLFTLLCCFSNTMGTLLMSSSMKTDVHPPCTALWYDNEKFLERFELGFLMSCASQLVVLLQAAICEPYSRDHAVFMASAKVVSMLILLLFPGKLAKYAIMASLVVLLYASTWMFTNIVALLDLHHLRGRMDLMVLVALGEWVITAILRETSIELIVAQTALALMLAAEYFNTRQHGHLAALAMSVRTPAALLKLESIEYILLHTIALALFFLPATLTIAQDYEESYSSHSSHSARALASHHCDLSDGHWTSQALRMHTAVLLMTTRLMLLFLRHIRKCKIAELPTPGKKFYVRFALCFVHLIIPFIGRMGFAHEPKLGPLFAIHAMVMFLDLTAELSLHQLAARRVHRIGAHAVAAIRRRTNAFSVSSSEV